MLKRILFVVAWSLVAASPGLAGQADPGVALPSERENWYRVRSPHFLVMSDAPELKTRKVVEDLETFRAVLSTFHSKLVIDPARPMLLILFKNDKDFAPFKPKVDSSKLIGGFMSSHPDQIVIAVEAVRFSQTSQIVYHEMLHQFLTENMPNTPVWFDEGIAEYYSTFEVDDKTVKVGLPIPGHVQYLATHPMMPLESLLQVTRDSPEYNEAARVGTFYAESWLVVHYLLNGDAKIRPRVGSFLDRLRGGVPMDEAFRSAFGMGYGGLMGQVQRYLGTGRFLYSTVKAPPSMDAEPPLRVRMPPEEVLAALGALLARSASDRSAESAAYFQKALRVNPKCASAEAGLGFLAATARRFPEAVSHFDAAMALDPGDFQITFWAALSRLEEAPRTADPNETPPSKVSSESLAKARELLRRTIQLRPGFGEAYVSLGKTYLEEDEPPREGIDLLLQAEKLLPVRMDVAAYLVLLYLKAGDRAAAGEQVDQIMAPGGDARALRLARLALEEYDAAQGKSLSKSPEAAREEPAGPDP